MSRIRPGEVVEGRYRLDRLLGEGGYGAVYAATHLEMGTPLALKLLHAHHADSEEATARFRREARNTARLRHPNCVTVFDFGRAQVGPLSEEVFFLAMELLEGQTLADLLRKGPIDPQRAMLLLDQILLALEAAHGLGLIHRDLKPDNVFLVPTGGLEHVKVLDFGIAKTLESEDSGSITASGTVIGTPAFMSPEQCRGTTIDARSDLYSLGCVAWAMLAGQPPFKRDSTLGYLLAHVQDAPGDIATVAFLHEIPPHLRRFIATCLEKHPDARYPTASAARRALAATGQHPAALTTARGMALQDPPTPRRSRWPILALGGAVVAVGVVLGLLLTGDDH
ncbi:MAG TPA: serine/threonine-protein kinase, partial [Myxococcota bacterium]|nr:serine/threonine-protein kinase [Myxococcota bacterium]